MFIATKRMYRTVVDFALRSTNINTSNILIFHLLCAPTVVYVFVAYNNIVRKLCPKDQGHRASIDYDHRYGGNVHTIYEQYPAPQISCMSRDSYIGMKG